MIVVIPTEWQSSSLANFLSFNKIAGITSNKQARDFIDKGLCRINGTIARKASQIVHPRDTIEIVEQVRVQKQEQFISQVVFEDSDLLIINKPVGVSTAPDEIYQLLKSLGITNQIYLVHRLDKTTSGLLLLAKNTSIEKKLVALFRERKISKEYLALVDGIVSHASGKITAPIAIESKHGSQIKMKVTSQDDKSSEKAETYWKKITASEKKASLLLVRPITGRTHQIRVHLKSIRHPIIGDIRYETTFQCSFLAPRPLLHAFRLSFIHPETKELITIKVEPPEDFTDMYQEIFQMPLTNLLRQI